jgi:beta-lactamase class A
MRRRVFLTAVCLIVPLGVTAQSEPWQQVREKTEAQLRAIAAGSPGVLGLAAVDLTNGERFAINENVVFPQGSAIKVAILIEVYKQAAEGKLKLSDRLPVRKAQQVGGDGVLQHFGDQTSELSVGDLCTLMIILSDNTAANLLIERVGRDNVNATLASLGLEKTRLGRKMMDLEALARSEDNLSTPAEGARLLEWLYRCDILSRTACDEILALLKRAEGSELKKGLPTGVVVAAKPGAIPGVRTEWAIVFLDARPYIVAVMESYSPEGEAGRDFEEISRIVYSYFRRRACSNRYGACVDPDRMH